MMNHWPAIILSALEDVDLVTTGRTVKSAGPMLGFPQKIRARLKINSLRVAISVSPNFWPRVGLTDKRIVTRHRAVIIQSQSLAGKRIEFLRQLTLRRVARRDVEFAVRAKPQTT